MLRVTGQEETTSKAQDQALHSLSSPHHVILLGKSSALYFQDSLQGRFIVEIPWFGFV